MMMAFINYARYIVVHIGENTYLIGDFFFSISPSNFFRESNLDDKKAMNYDKIWNSHARKNISSARLFINVSSDHYFNYKKDWFMPKNPLW